MNVITREELKERLDRGTPFKLIMVLDENAFARKHIPGSINIPYGSPALDSLNPDEELVVYCSGMPCPVSWLAAKRLASRGFRRVRYYAGGLADWEEAGYPVEGAWVTQSAPAKMAGSFQPATP